MAIKEENLIQYTGTLKAGQRLVKVGNTFIPVGIGGAIQQGSGTVDTSAFEAAALAIIGEATSVPENPEEEKETLEGCVFAANMQTPSATYKDEIITLEGVNLADAPGYTDGTKMIVSSMAFPASNHANLFENGDITIACSVYMSSSYASGDQYFVDLKNAAGDRRFQIRQSWSGGNILDTIQSYVGDNTEPISVGFDGWHHVVIQQHGTSFMRMYIDKAQRWSKDWAYNPEGVSDWTSINTLLDGNSGMKDLQIYNRVLSEDEIITLYEKAKLPTGA